MPPVDALVAEIAIDLKDLSHAAHEQSLEIQLWRNSQVQIDIKRVVMRRKRPRCSAACDRLHHGRLDFDKPVPLHESPCRRHDLAAAMEGLHRLRGGVHVHIAATVSLLGIGQAMIFLGRRRQRLAVHLKSIGPDADLAAFGAANRPRCNDDVTVVHLGSEFE